MNASRATTRTMLLLAGVSMLIGALATVVVAAIALRSGLADPKVTVWSGPRVEVPQARLFGGSVTVYTAERSGDSPHELGCRLVDADGAVAQSTRLSGFTHALGDPITVDGATWYPFTEVDLGTSRATLECPGTTVLRPAAVSAPSTFGGSATMIGTFAAGSAVLLLGGGTLALVAARRLH